MDIAMLSVSAQSQLSHKLLQDNHLTGFVSAMSARLFPYSMIKSMAQSCLS